MIRPCPTCNGSGIDPVSYVDATPLMPSQAEPCPTCVTMPRLSAKVDYRLWTQWAFVDAEQARLIRERGWFKPDPDSVIRWCQTHNHREQGMGECYLAFGRAWFDECSFVWVAVPEPLEEA